MPGRGEGGLEYKKGGNVTPKGDQSWHGSHIFGPLKETNLI